METIAKAMDVEAHAKTIGTSVEGLKLFLTVLLGLVIAMFHRLFLFNKPKNVQHIAFTLIGFALLYWNYGIGVFHSFICIMSQWLFFHIFGTGNKSAIISFTFNMGYLLGGYFATTTSGYDITWTMPHCILSLRLIGLAFDVHDGHKDPSTVTNEQKQYLIEDIPSMLETFGFCYFYGTFLVGPQSSMRRYRKLVDGKLTDVQGQVPNSIAPAFVRFLCGIAVFGFHFYLKSVMRPPHNIPKEQFQDIGFLMLSLQVLFGAYVFFTQYIGIWMINEATCILCGLGYKYDKGTVAWDALRNVRCTKFFSASCYQDMIESFNMNTNTWVARYVFKRLRFLGNKTVSHVCALFFLAIWHGYHEGYFFTFFFEYVVMTAERPARVTLNKFKFIQTWKASSMWWLYQLCGWIYVKIAFGYCIAAFAALKWPLFLPVYNRLFWYGHVFYFVVWVCTKILDAILSSSSQKVIKKE